MKDLLKVKSIVTFNVMIIFTFLALKGTFDAKDVLLIISNVLTYYFAKGSVVKDE